MISGGLKFGDGKTGIVTELQIAVISLNKYAALLCELPLSGKCYIPAVPKAPPAGRE